MKGEEQLSGSGRSESSEDRHAVFSWLLSHRLTSLTHPQMWGEAETGSAYGGKGRKDEEEHWKWDSCDRLHEDMGEGLSAPQTSLF